MDGASPASQIPAMGAWAIPARAEASNDAGRFGEAAPERRCAEIESAHVSESNHFA
jgi:hypothetical protein